MRKLLLSCAFLVFSFTVAAQDLPDNPELGKCYVRCKTPDVWKNEEVTIETAPSYKKLISHPAEYRTEKVTVVGKEAGSSLSIIPAEYRNENFTVVTKEPSYSLEVISAKRSTTSETITTSEASYSLVLVPAVYETKSFEIETSPAYKKLVVVPATYKTLTENVVCQVSSERLEVVPGEWGTESVSYIEKEFGTKLSVIPANFSKTSETIETKASSAQWQMSEKAPDCQSSDPNDCRYWCFKEIPAQFTTISKTILTNDASSVRDNVCDDPSCGKATYTKKLMTRQPSTRVVKIPEVVKIYKKTVMVTPPSTREVVVPAVVKTFKKRVMVTPPTTKRMEIPAQTKQITKTVIIPATTTRIDIPQKTKTMVKTVLVSAAKANTTAIPESSKTLTKTILVKDAWAEEVMVPAQYKTISKEILISKGGLTTWKEVECKDLEYSPLPIRWNLGSATLTSAAKQLIDARLLPILNKGVSTEIASHTDSRGSKTSNQALSERRAQSVVNYLMSKGVNASQLVANGFGENKLTNRCSDGVSCTEAEHARNRRTEFRVISQ